jgi:hypothetical protein
LGVVIMLCAVFFFSAPMALPQYIFILSSAGALLGLLFPNTCGMP